MKEGRKACPPYSASTLSENDGVTVFGASHQEKHSGGAGIVVER